MKKKIVQPVQQAYKNQKYSHNSIFIDGDKILQPYKLNPIVKVSLINPLTQKICPINTPNSNLMHLEANCR